MKKRIVYVFFAILALFSVICLATENTEELENTSYTIPEEYRRGGDVMPISETSSEEYSTDDIMLISEDGDEIQYTEGDRLIGEDESTIIKNENIDGNVFAIVTPNLTIENTTIYGNLFVMANYIELKNVHVTGSIFAMAQEMITSELYVNEVYILGSHISLDGTIAREMKISAEQVDINCQVSGNTFISATDVTLGDNAALYKNADINYTSTYTQSETATCENLKLNKNNTTEEKSNSRNEQIKSEIVKWIIEIIKTIIVTGFIILFTDRKFERFASKLSNKNYITLTLKGFIWLIVIPVTVIILIIISKTYLLGFSMLVLVIYFIIAYLSLQIVSISIGSNIKNKKMADKGNIEYIGITLIVMTIIWLLGKLPIIGNIVWVIVVMLSFGTMIKFIFNSKEKNIENKE